MLPLIFAAALATAGTPSVANAQYMRFSSPQFYSPAHMILLRSGYRRFPLTSYIPATTTMPMNFVIPPPPAFSPTTTQPIYPVPEPIAPTPVPTPTPSPSGNLSQLEALVLQYSNDARTQNGLAPLSENTTLDSVARAHSTDMLQNNYFDHNDQSGCSPGCRITNAGYSWQAIGENIHMMSGYQLSLSDSAHKIVNDWLNSPEHRANLLSSTYTQMGIGVVQSGDSYYSTADYALPN